jgi:Arc/MetJ-type ribon-helix-helix transcriptional regulator
MATELPLDLQQMVDNQLATGLYANPEEVLREAMQLLVEQRSAIDDVMASAKDFDHGRVQPLDVVVDAIRRRHGWTP